jgi:hypothetical protein
MSTVSTGRFRARRAAALAVLGLTGLGLVACGPAATGTDVGSSAAALAPAISSPAPVPVTTTPPPAPAAVLVMTCPPGGSQASPVFGHQITATAPYTVSIDYGDGDRYSNDDQHLAAVFSHTYATGGTFTVSASLTDAAQQTAQSTCDYTWAPPARVVAPAPAPVPAPAPGQAPAPAPAQGPVVHPGAFCSPQGAVGVTSSGTAMVCTTTATDSRARWRAA